MFVLGNHSRPVLTCAVGPWLVFTRVHLAQISLGLEWLPRWMAPNRCGTCLPLTMCPSRLPVNPSVM